VTLRTYMVYAVYLKKYGNGHHISPTQAYVLAQRPVQELPTAGFHRMKFATVIPLSRAIVSQVCPCVTRWNVSQFVTMPSCVGVGVATPLPCVVVVRLVVVVVGGGGVCPMMLTQTYALAHRPEHALPPTSGFQVVNSVKLMRYKVAMVAHD
jgi:hypothetical protein